ncbi:forkhead box protein [Clostridium sp. MSJ-4]|uniref:Forkhead box protein n=1 Tax=Clostridium simiarum TaxID=2841506 RepID=A0ABS6F2B6_9CLOT|nr:forkhead box protein [Clostridium simiarum]
MHIVEAIKASEKGLTLDEIYDYLLTLAPIGYDKL